MNFLPGWAHGFTTARRQLTSLAQQATASAGATSIACPTVQAGDLIVVLSYAVGSAAFVTPTGFTTILQSNLSTTRQVISCKVSDGTESGSTLNGMTGSGFGMIVVTFRGNVPLVAALVFAALGEVTDGNPAVQTVLSGAGGPPLIVLAAYSSTGSINPRTFTPTKDGEVTNGGNNQYIAWKTYFGGPANVDVDMDDEGTGNALQSAYLRLIT